MDIYLCTLEDSLDPSEQAPRGGQSLVLFIHSSFTLHSHNRHPIRQGENVEPWVPPP